MYKIGKNNFKTKKEAENFTRNYINKLGCGLTSILDVEPFKFFIDLINNHPYAKDKIGCGIKYILIQKNSLNKKTPSKGVFYFSKNSSWLFLSAKFIINFSF